MWVQGEDEHGIYYFDDEEDKHKLDNDISWFRRNPTAHRAKVVFLGCVEQKRDVPSYIMKKLCADLQKQVDDYEELHPRYTDHGLMMDITNCCIGLAGLSSRTKVSIFKKLAEVLKIPATEKTEGWEILRDRYKRWLKNSDFG